MISVTTILNKENINTIQFIVNGSLSYLNAISKIELWIPELNLKITDSTPTDYPLKWEFSPERIGILEMKLGNQQSLIDFYTLTTTGDILDGSIEIENIPESDFDKLKKRMMVFGTGIGSGSQITRIKKSESKVYLNVESTADLIGTDLTFFQEYDENIHLAKLYIFNPTFPTGIHWADFKLQVELGI